MHNAECGIDETTSQNISKYWAESKCLPLHVSTQQKIISRLGFCLHVVKTLQEFCRVLTYVLTYMLLVNCLGGYHESLCGHGRVWMHSTPFATPWRAPFVESSYPLHAHAGSASAYLLSLYRRFWQSPVTHRDVDAEWFS